MTPMALVVVPMFCEAPIVVRNETFSGVMPIKIFSPPTCNRETFCLEARFSEARVLMVTGGSGLKSPALAARRLRNGLKNRLTNNKISITAEKRATCVSFSL